MKNKRGVDISNKFIIEYEMDSKITKWWKLIFFNLLDVAIVNYWIVYTIHILKHKIFQLEFRLSKVDFVRSKKPKKHIKRI